jgi:ribosomal protein S18 acetylase RimI-like enzyme
VKQRIVRLARPEDARGIAEAQIGGWLVAYRGVIADEVLDGLSVERATSHWTGRLQEDVADFWVCEIRPLSQTEAGEPSGSVVGFVWFGATHDEDSDADRVGEVNALYVAPTHWGKGHGRAMMHVAEERLRDAGYKEATLWVLRDNRLGRGFYEALGWRCDGGEKLRDWRGLATLDLVRYRRSLADVMAE